MPRGVYDRSKAAKKSEATDVQKVKKQRAPYGSKKATAGLGATHQASPRRVEVYSIQDLAALRGSFSGPSTNTIIIGKIDALVARQLDAVIGQLPTQEPNGSSKRVVQAPAPVAQQAQAPAPTAAFNPPTPTDA